MIFGLSHIPKVTEFPTFSQFASKWDVWIISTFRPIRGETAIDQPLSVKNLENQARINNPGTETNQ